MQQMHGPTPLGNAELAKLLLDHGADPKIADVYGNTFNDIATAVGTPISPTKLREVLGMSVPPL